MNKSRLYILKLGGSLITDKLREYTPRIDVIRRLAMEIKEGYIDDYKLIIGHGGGSFPHVSAAKYKTSLGFIDEDSKRGMSIVHYDALRLNMILLKEFLDAGLNVYTIHPSSISLSKRGKIVSIYIKPIIQLLQNDIIPLVYGDVGIDIIQGCSILSTEEIIRVLSIKLRKYYQPFIVMCGIVDGVYDKDPVKYPEANFIHEVNRLNIRRILRYLGGSYGIDVTGGMRTKIKILYELAKYGVNSMILNCLKPGNLKSFLEGVEVKGTIVKY